MEEKAVKAGLAGIGTILAFLNESFTPLIFILIAFELADYATGIISAAKTQGGISKNVALWGAVKKIGYFILIGVAFLFDYVILEVSREMGITFEWKAYLGIMSVCYLISTEGISILENLGELGVNIPFLTKALKIFQDKIIKKGDGEIGKAENSN